MEQFLDEVRKEYDDTQNNQNKEKIITIYFQNISNI